MFRTSAYPPAGRTGQRALGVTAALLLLTAGCATGGDGGTEARKTAPAPTRASAFRAADLQPGAPLPLTGVTWQFTDTHDGSGDGKVGFENNARMTIADDLSVRGFTGCNDFTARVSFPALTPEQKAHHADETPNPIAFHDVTVDKKAKCRTELSDSLEGLLQSTLRTPGLTYVQLPYEDSLALMTGGALAATHINARVAPLTSEELGPLTGTKWYPDKPNWPVGEDTAPYFWIEEDGTVRGHTGCRPFTARAKTDTTTHRLTFSGPQTQGPRSCGDEEGTYEKAFLRKFDETWKYEQSFHRVFMRRTSDDKAFFAYTPGPPETAEPPASPADTWQDDHELTGPRWTVDSLAPKPDSSGSGSERIAPAPGAYLRIDERGFAIGHTGCETFTAQANITADRVTVHHVAEVTTNGTRCSEPDRTAGHEFLTRFASGFRYERDESGTGWRAEPLNGTPGFTLTTS
ncbi:META domain-containing protein [Streptomyces sp. NPDC021093]|uniref:META domain-containing protein n=1 Tax=Streptomyces sp. NPDC021093 TaxID=3365112 RepID=UPI0037B086F6